MCYYIHTCCMSCEVRSVSSSNSGEQSSERTGTPSSGSGSLGRGGAVRGVGGGGGGEEGGVFTLSPW